MKTCSRCKQTYPITSFHTKKSNKDGLQKNCKTCKTEYNKKHYINNKTKYKQKAKKHRAVLREWYIEFKKQLSCLNCGESDWRCLDHHHKDPSIKEFTISLYYTVSKNKLLRELEKCEVLCANCHRKQNIK